MKNHPDRVIQILLFTLVMLLPTAVQALDEDTCTSNAVPRTTSSADFTVFSGGSVVRHETTGLEWQRCAFGQSWDGVTCSGSASGTTERFNTGNCITTAQASFLGTSPAQGCPMGDVFGRPMPVGSFHVNAFGLNDTHGGVWEWVQDCWNEDYNSAPTNGNAWMSGQCQLAVLRGGSFASEGFRARSAHRKWANHEMFHHSWGFRVARSVNW